MSTQPFIKGNTVTDGKSSVVFSCQAEATRFMKQLFGSKMPNFQNHLNEQNEATEVYFQEIKEKRMMCNK